MTPEELERRRNVIGASEVGLLFGLPSFGGRTLSDLWFEKKYGTEGSKGTASTKAGLRLESAVLEFAEERLGMPVIDRQLWLTRGPNAATLDGRTCATDVVEAKTHGILWQQRNPDEVWGPDGSDEIPDAYLLQVQCQMLVSGANIGKLAALIGGLGWRMYFVQPHSQLQAEISRRSTEFIQSLAADVAPEEAPTLETLKRLRRQPNKVIERSEELDALWAKLEEAKAVATASKDASESLQRALLAKLADAEAAETAGGLITYYEQTRKETIQAASTFRVLRFKKGA